MRSSGGGGSSEAGLRVLVLEDEAALRRGYVRWIEGFPRGSVMGVGAGTVAEARELLGSGQVWHGAVLDERLPDGSGVELLEELRQAGVLIPAMVVTGLESTELMRRVQMLQAFYLPKACERVHVWSFVERVQVLWERWASMRLEAETRTLASRHRLSPREEQTLLQLARGLHCREIAERHKIASTTVKTQCNRIADKTGLTAGDLAHAIRQSVLEDELDPASHRLLIEPVRRSTRGRRPSPARSCAEDEVVAAQ
jgi:two-component system, NarL family, response regulator DevR